MRKTADEGPTATYTAVFRITDQSKVAASSAKAFYAGGIAHNMLMDRLLRQKIAHQDAPTAWGYQEVQERIPELQTFVIQAIERVQVAAEWKRYRDDRFKNGKASGIPYVARVKYLSLHADLWEWKEEDGRFFIRFRLWRTKAFEKQTDRVAAETANSEWHEVIPEGPRPAALLRDCAAGLKKNLPGYKMCQPRLVWAKDARNKKRRWRFEFVLTVPAAAQRQGSVAAGIDLGVNHFVVVSVPELRKSWYFSRRDLRHRQDRYSRKRRELGAAYGSKATARMRDSEARFTDGIIKTTVRQIIERLNLCLEVSVIKVERLTGIRDGAAGREVGMETARMLARFPYYAFQLRLRQVAEAEGFTVVEVVAAYTSQTCSHCGARGTRNKHDFYCPQCDKHFEADLNAANNIAQAEPLKPERKAA